MEKKKDANILLLQPYLSELDYEIIQDVSSGIHPKMVAESYYVTEQEVSMLFERAMEKLRHLMDLAMASRRDQSRDFIQDTLNFLGFYPFTVGVRELEVAIRLAAENPQLLNNLGQDLYPAVGREVEKKPTMAANRIYRALEEKRKFYVQSETRPDFYNDINLLYLRTNVKYFIRTFLIYAEQREAVFVAAAAAPAAV